MEPNRPNSAGGEPSDRFGVAVTYATVASAPGVHRRRCAELPTLLIADEPHHLGEQAAWGAATMSAFAGARLRLLLSGTPFRSDSTPIPWVSYDEDGVSRADYRYGYTQALLDGVCRPVTFHTYGGDMEWVSDGRVRRAGFDVALGAVESARRLRTALDPDGDWVGSVLRDAHARLVSLRAGSHPDAGGLVVAIDKEHAERLRARLSRVCGEPVEMVTSDTPGASAAIARFAAGSAPWLVSVLMVSEGVDVPRLRVGVYATTARTELFFRQVVGRFVRRTPAPRDQMSHLFLPSDPRLKALAACIEEERDHALAPSAAPSDALERAEAARGEEAFRALWSSARRDDEILQTTQPGDALPLFGELPAAPVAPVAPAVVVESAFERRERLRAERQALVAAVARLTGEAHRTINARVNRETGVASVAAATDEQLEGANRKLEREARRLGR